MSERQVRVEPQGLDIVGLGLGRPAQLTEDIAQVVPPQGKVGSEPHGLAGVEKGLVEQAGLVEGPAEIAVQDAVVRAVLQGESEVVDGRLAGASS